MVNKSKDWGGSRKGAGRPRRNIHLDKETARLIAQMQRRSSEPLTEEQVIHSLAFMVGDLWALANIAEVFAPTLFNNTRWNSLKKALEQRIERIGVNAFLEEVSTHIIEAQED